MLSSCCAGKILAVSTLADVLEGLSFFMTILGFCFTLAGAGASELCSATSSCVVGAMGLASVGIAETGSCAEFSSCGVAGSSIKSSTKEVKYAALLLSAAGAGRVLVRSVGVGSSSDTGVVSDTWLLGSLMLFSTCSSTAASKLSSNMSSFEAGCTEAVGT